MPFEQVVSVSLNPATDRVVEVPGFCLGGHQRGRRLARYPAGKAINMARAMASLGQPCAVTGFIGRDEASWYRQFLEEQGGGECHLVSVDGATRENISVIDPQSPGADTHLVEQGFSVSEKEIAQLQEKLGELAGPNRLIAFCGSLPPGLSVEQYRELLQLCLDQGAQVAVDSSGDALRVASELPLWLVKPNLEELAELVDRPLTTFEQQQAAAAELAKSIRWVLLSGGADGAWLVDADHSLGARAKVAAQQIVGTVGCGDALLGGFLAGWQSDHHETQDRPKAALHQGVAAASYAATQLAREINTERVNEMLSNIESTL